jgi:hypothetical protein
MLLVIKNGQRQALQLVCKKVVIEITNYKLKCKRATRLKIKAKGKCPKTLQARL